MQSTPKISVIIPIYKVERYIERCASALFEQTLSEMEFIFVNDGTPDRSVELLKQTIDKYPNRQSQIKILHQKQNSGLTSSRNLGIAESTGDFIIHCDSDDWAERNMYEKLYQKAMDTNADIVICDFYMDYKTKSIHCNQPKLDHKEQVIDGLLRGTLHGNVWAKLVKRELYITNNIYFPENITMWEDLWTTTRLIFNAQKIEFIHEPLYHYIQYNQNSLISKYNAKYIDDSINVCGMIEQLLKQNHMFEQFYPSFLFLVYRSTKILVLNPQYRDFARWRVLWPELVVEMQQIQIPWIQRKIFSWVAKGKNKRAVCIIELKHFLARFQTSSRV